MSRSIAVYHVKPSQLPPWNPSPPSPEPGFVMELEHRVWLARFGRRHVDPRRYAWDAYDEELTLPSTWQLSPLSTSAFGGSFEPGELRPRGAAPDGERAWGPTPGDRVVAYRRESQEIVGVWLVNGARYGSGGHVSYGVRPLVSCLRPVAVAPGRVADADLDEAWETTFGRRSAARGTLLAIDGPALSGILRTVGIDPRLLCGPIEALPDCSLSNRPPEAGFRSATRLQTVLGEAQRQRERGLAEAVDWLLAGSMPEGAAARHAVLDVETVGCADAPGVHLVVRSSDDTVCEAMCLATGAVDLYNLELCPTMVHEAVDAAETGRSWSLVVTFDAVGPGRTVRFDALAVALCFDPSSGKVVNRREGL